MNLHYTDSNLYIRETNMTSVFLFLPGPEKQKEREEKQIVRRLLFFTLFFFSFCSCIVNIYDVLDNYVIFI
jgi:hypothetical protein